MPHWFYILSFFILGSCVGSFLNVVVWRLPRGENLSYPPSHCPKCNKPLKFYDNLPIIGWIKLAGKCRFCREPISVRYPIVETITALLFVFYYVMFYMLGFAPCAPATPMPAIGDRIPLHGPPLVFSQTWPVYALYMLMICGLLAASLVDFELFIIPIQIPWVIAGAGAIVHAIIDRPTMPGALNTNPAVAALGAGGAIGLLASIALFHLKHIPQSFPLGDPLLDIDRDAAQREIDEARRSGQEIPDLPPHYSSAEIRSEMRKEMLFLMPPMLMAAIVWLLVTRVTSINQAWMGVQCHWLTGLCGAIFGALVGAFVVWITRILGTLGFGRVAMGLGDVHLMLGVGAVIGAGASTVAFFIAPFFGIILAVYLLLTGKRRELPYGPYLSMATAFILISYCPISAYLTPGMMGLRLYISQLLGI